MFITDNAVLHNIGAYFLDARYSIYSIRKYDSFSAVKARYTSPSFMRRVHGP